MVEQTQEHLIMLFVRQQEKPRGKKSWVIRSLFHGLCCLCDAACQTESVIHVASLWGRWRPPALLLRDGQIALALTTSGASSRPWSTNPGATLRPWTFAVGVGKAVCPQACDVISTRSAAAEIAG